MLRKIIAAAAIAALLAGPAYAQSFTFPTGDRHLSPDELHKEQTEEGAYKRAISDLPDKPKKADPWGNVRSQPQASSGTGKKARQQ